jgi:hypothetical protein
MFQLHSGLGTYVKCGVGTYVGGVDFGDKLLIDKILHICRFDLSGFVAVVGTGVL